MEGRFVEVYRLRAVQDMQACAGAWSRHKSMCKLCTVFRILSSLSFRGFRPDMNLIHCASRGGVHVRIWGCCDTAALGVCGRKAHGDCSVRRNRGGAHTSSKCARLVARIFHTVCEEASLDFRKRDVTGRSGGTYWGHGACSHTSCAPCPCV